MLLVNGANFMSATLYAIGVGPGDPELITIKAVNTIREADVIAIPQKRDECRAFDIALKAVPEIGNKEIIDCAFSMTQDEKTRNDLHKDIYEKIKAQIQNGKSVAFLTIGDPAIYSTFSYINDLAKSDGIKCMMISGVTSASACAAALGIDLCIGKQPLHIYPGTEDIDEAIKLPGTKVFMKGGKDIAKLKHALSANPVVTQVLAVSHCGTEEEKCFGSVDELYDEAAYLTTVIVK